MQPTPILEALTRLLGSLQAGVVHFQNGEDQAGLACIFDSLDDMEHLLDLCRSLGEPAIPPEKGMRALQKLDDLLQNRDITGLTDYLEDTVCPAVQSLTGECDE